MNFGAPKYSESLTENHCNSESAGIYPQINLDL